MTFRTALPRQITPSPRARRWTPTTAIRSRSPRPGRISTSVIYTRTWWARSSSKRQRAATLRNDATIDDSNRTYARSWTTEHDTMANDAVGEQERMRRFRDAALPHLDEVYTLARYLMRNTDDAEDAVQECYLRALRHFDSYRGPAMKAWLLAILKNVCNSEFLRRSRGEMPTDYAQGESAAE